MNISGIKGMNDILPGDVEAWQYLEREARRIFGNFGYREIRVKFRVKGDVDEETVQELVRKSPVYDTLANPVNIRIEVEKE